MSETLLVPLEPVLLPGESLKFTIFRHPKGLVVLMQPSMGKPGKDLPKEVERARAALAMPCRFVGSALELDATFAAKIKGYAEPRREVYDNYEAQIEALREAAKETKAKTAQTIKSGVSKPKPTAPSAAAAAPPAATTASIEHEPCTASDNSAASAPSSDTGVMQPVSLF